MATEAKEGARRKGRNTRGRVHGIRFDWDDHGCNGYAVPIQDRTHEDSSDLIAAKIRRSWDDEAAVADPGDRCAHGEDGETEGEEEKEKEEEKERPGSVQGSESGRDS